MRTPLDVPSVRVCVCACACMAALCFPFEGHSSMGVRPYFRNPLRARGLPPRPNPASYSAGPEVTVPFEADLPSMPCAHQLPPQTETT